MIAIDRETKNWIRNAADERAAANGCRFDPERAQFVVNWIQTYCRLYEGERAGELLELRDWALLAVQHLFGWVKHSDAWGREVRRFRRGGVWVPKKNKKSPTLAAIGLYMWAGDGEQGQKIFSAAKDGKQAGIAHQHALEMVKQSPELMDECKINHSSKDLIHLPSRSVYRIVAGDNKDSQEGLNGSVLIDETHVVDRRLASILKYAGASRSEPLHLEFSTAGNNPDGYGKGQFDYGLRVEKGDTNDEGFFFLSYHADQNIADDELDANIEAIGKAANPAWGHTIQRDEFLSSYETAKRSITDLLDFKMYRLNIWQRSANPFIKAGDWEACRRDFTLEDLEGANCFAGLDLAKVKDTTSLVLIFPEGDSCKMLSWFWLPEDRARIYATKVPDLLQWAKDGYLRLTPGNTADYGYIKKDLRDIAERYRIERLMFDPMYADTLTQQLCDGEALPGGAFADGIGAERVEFPQTIKPFSAPTAEFEKRILSQRLHHNGHPVMTWQVGHVEVYRSANNDMRPIKAKDDDVKKIDGPVACIMALSQLLDPEDDFAGLLAQRGFASL